jgi:mycothiol synthase
MNDILSRPYNYLKDKKDIEALLITYRTATNVWIYPTTWRLSLVLSSRVWEPGQDSRIWEDGSGHVVAFAMLWRRQRTSPYLVFDRFVNPVGVTDDLIEAILDWGTKRAYVLAAESNSPITLYTRQLAAVIHADHQLEKYGFTLVKPDPQAHNVYFGRSLQNTMPEPVLPFGYTIRPLQSTDEQEAYDGLYDFATVSLEHRREMFNSDEYGHLVVVDPTGVFVAYCEYSICRAEWQQSGHRLGWIDYIGTRPENRQQGLGRAVLLASLHDLQASGAETAMLVTISTNRSAIKLYDTTGFTHMDVLEAPSLEKLVLLAE